MPDDQLTPISRAYVRVDRVKMQDLMRGKYLDKGGLTIASKLMATRLGANLFDRDLVHTADGSELTLDNGQLVKCRVLIDASGLESRLVAKEVPMLARGNNEELPTGFQIAYGLIAHVDSLGPYKRDAMTLFDYRTDHFEAGSAEMKDAIDRPTVVH